MSEINIDSHHSQARAGGGGEAVVADDIFGGGVGDYFQLLKPRVMSLVIFTSFVGLIAAPGTLHPLLAFTALLAIAVGAGASGALNMWYDADIDCKMQRTANRPIPRGKISKQEALAFGVFLSVASVITLGMAVNWVAASLLALTISYYLFVYTIWLKRRTPHNIVIGGAAGAFPPMIGWAAVTGGVGVESIVLFLIIFMWTPPHFWALSLYRCRDYARVGVPMLPVVEGADETRRQILIYSVLLAAISFLPLWVNLGGIVYGVAATLLNGMFLWLAVKVYTVRRGQIADKAAKRLFLFSIFYLFALFLVILVEQVLPMI